MNYNSSDGWGTWNFSSNSQVELELLKSNFECTSSNPNTCHNLNNSLWRLLIGDVIIRNGTAVVHNFNLPCSMEKDESITNIDGLSTMSVNEKNKLSDGSNYQGTGGNEDEKLMRNATPEIPTSFENYPSEELNSENADDEMLEFVGDVCDLLKKGPVNGLTAKLKGKDLDSVLKAIKSNLSNEETIANLILSICPPLEEDLLEQSRWAPALYQQIVLPEVRERSQTMTRLLSSAISLLASSFPDACIQFLCIPLLVSTFQEEQSTELSQSIVEVLTKIVEESLPQQQRVLLFRTYFKGAANQEKTSHENLFPILLMLAESQGAFSGADSEFLLNLINWLEITSQDHFCNIKFTKFLVAVLTGIAQDVESRKEGNAYSLSPENILKLKNIISQNKTFLKKKAEKTLKSISLFLVNQSALSKNTWHF